MCRCPTVTKQCNPVLALTVGACSSPITRVGLTEQGPGKNRQSPGKNNWTDHVPSGLPDKNFGILGHFYFLVLIINACLHS